MGQPGLPGLCILGRRYREGGAVCFGQVLVGISSGDEMVKVLVVGLSGVGKWIDRKDDGSPPQGNHPCRG